MNSSQRFPCALLVVGCALFLTLGCAPPSPSAEGLEEVQQALGESVSIDSVPLTVSAGSTYSGTMTYTASVSGYLQLRLFNASGTKLVENQVSVTAGTATRSISVTVPAGTPNGSGYYWNAMLFNSSWATVTSATRTGVTVGSSSTSPAVSIDSVPLTVSAGSTYSGTMTYTASVSGYLQLRLFSASGTKVVENHVSVTAGTATRSISVTVPAGTPNGSGYYWDAMLFNASWATVASVTRTGVTVGSVSSGGPLGVPGNWGLLFTDEFNGSALDTTKWNQKDPWHSASGYPCDGCDAWFTLPTTTNELEIVGGLLKLKARRAANPGGKAFTSAQLNSFEKFSIPAQVTSYTEARLKAPVGKGLWPALWLLGNGTGATNQAWPITGEVDILEFANNASEYGKPYVSVWYPKDVWTNPPGSQFNSTHVTHPDSWVTRTDLIGSFHTWGLYRSPSKMEVYIDGVKLLTLLPNEVYYDWQGIAQPALPPMLFTNDMHLRLSHAVGGWGGDGYTPSQYEPGDYEVDYVKVWKLN